MKKNLLSVYFLWYEFFKSSGPNYEKVIPHHWTIGKKNKTEPTPHAFVIWKENKQWIIKYSVAAIDDNGEHPEKANPYIANAVEDLLDGKPVKMPETQSFGCAIFYRK